MGNKFDRLCSRHRWVPVLVMALLWSLLLLLELEEWAWWILIPLTFCMLLSLLMGSACTMRLMNPTVKMMQEQCDPFPLLEETSYQLGYVKNRSDRTLLTINKASGLMAAGYHHQALEELEALDIHDPAVPTGWRYTYYHNLTAAAIRCGYMEKAQTYYQTAIQQFSALKGKPQEDLQSNRVHLSAELCMMQGAYAQAYDLLSKVASKNLYEQVVRAYDLAEIAVAQGQPQTARIHLDFVFRYGNRLYTVAKAQKLVEELNKEPLSE